MPVTNFTAHRMSGILCDLKAHRQQLTLSVRVFSSLLGEGVACQWTASSSLTFVASNPASVIASGVFFDGWPYLSPSVCFRPQIASRHCVYPHSRGCVDMVSFECAPFMPLHVYSTTCRFLGSSTRTSVVGAIPPSHCLVLGSCSRSLNDGNSAQRMMLTGLCTHLPLAVVNELRCNTIHSRGIMFNSHKKPPPPQQQLRPAFSAVVVERLHIKEIGEFVSATLSLEVLSSLSHIMRRFCMKTVVPVHFSATAPYASSPTGVVFKLLTLLASCIR
jgi:hypothetical protein